MEETKLTPQRQLVQLITNYWKAQSIIAAAKVRIADHVKDGPKTAEQLAPLTGTQPQPLYRLLRALASIEIFVEDEQGRFGLTPMAECLLDRPGSQRAVALLMGDEHYRSWGEIVYSL